MLKREVARKFADAVQPGRTGKNALPDGPARYLLMPPEVISSNSRPYLTEEELAELDRELALQFSVNSEADKAYRRQQAKVQKKTFNQTDHSLFTRLCYKTNDKVIQEFLSKPALVKAFQIALEEVRALLYAMYPEHMHEKIETILKKFQK